VASIPFVVRVALSEQATLSQSEIASMGDAYNGAYESVDRERPDEKDGHLNPEGKARGSGRRRDLRLVSPVTVRTREILATLATPWFRQRERYSRPHKATE
jgi:hypothetical protein